MLPSERHPEQARMPEHLIARTINEMEVGEMRCASIYSIWVDNEKRCWLHPLQSTSQELTEKRPVIIEKTDDGFVVDISYVGHEWDVETDEDLNNVGLAERGLELIPIFDLKFPIDTPVINQEFKSWASTHGIEV